MAIKELTVPDIGPVRFQKRRGTRSIRIYISGSEVRVTLPHWVSYSQALEFASKRAEWIKKHRQTSPVLAEGSIIGKQHRIVRGSGSLRTRVTDTEVIVTMPENASLDDVHIQERLVKACERALLRESQQLVIPRLQDLAFEHGIEINNIAVKKLKRRWGSCDHQANIVLNVYLVQLPWEFIDYVLLHELAHVQHLNHSTEFWQQLKELYPASVQLKKAIKDYHPQLMPN